MMVSDTTTHVLWVHQYWLYELVKQLDSFTLVSIPAAAGRDIVTWKEATLPEVVSGPVQLHPGAAGAPVGN